MLAIFSELGNRIDGVTLFLQSLLAVLSFCFPLINVIKLWKPYPSLVIFPSILIMNRRQVEKPPGGA